MNRAEKSRRQKKARKAVRGQGGDTPAVANLEPGLQALLVKGVQAHQAGQLPEAEAAYRKILDAHPEHADANHLLGTIALQVGDHEAAIQLIAKAIRANPAAAPFHNKMGNAQKALGKLDDAVASYRKAIAIKPDDAEALSNLGLALAELGRLEEAVDSYKGALRINPDQFGAHVKLGLVLKDMGNLEEAIGHFRQAIIAHPDDAGLHAVLGNVLHEKNLLSDAAASYQKALVLNPNDAETYSNLGTAQLKMDFPEDAAASCRKALGLNPAIAEAHNNLGLALKRLDRPEEAEASYRKALDIDPDYAIALNNLGFALNKRGRPEEAESSFRKALDIDPNYADALDNLGDLLAGQGRLDEAIDYFQKAIAADPDYTEPHCSLGSVLFRQGKLKESEDSSLQALKLDPNYLQAHVNLGILYLLWGRFQKGWAEYAWRWQLDEYANKLKIQASEWNGSDIENKTILVLSEQGIGDEIMFASMIPDLIATGARVILESDYRLIPLYQRSFPRIECIAKGDLSASNTRQEDINFQVSVGGLARWFRPDIGSFPTHHSFLKADTDRTAALKTRYQEKFPGKLIVGLSWRSGSQVMKGKRSVPLVDWLPILSNPRCAFVNLQYGDVEEELDDLRLNHGIDVLRDPDIDPFMDIDGLSSQISAMDSVFSVTNITLHLAGALGVSTWALLMKTPDWRWMLDRDDSPWYPRMRLFRQEERDDWAGVIERIAEELLRETAEGLDDRP